VTSREPITKGLVVGQGRAPKHPPPAPRVLPEPKKLNEKDLTRAVAQTAKDWGWLRYHTHRSDFSPAGYPDETLIRGPRLVIAELKSDNGVVSDKQREWLDALAAVPGIEVYLWRPSDWWDGTIARVLM
jgi:hypothetical protein